MSAARVQRAGRNGQGRLRIMNSIDTIGFRQLKSGGETRLLPLSVAQRGLWIAHKIAHPTPS